MMDDRDDDPGAPLGPTVFCDHCNLDLGEHPVGSYAHCAECDGAYLARWPEPPYEPDDAAIQWDELAQSFSALREAYDALVVDYDRVVRELAAVHGPNDGPPSEWPRLTARHEAPAYGCFLPLSPHISVLMLHATIIEVRVATEGACQTPRVALAVAVEREDTPGESCVLCQFRVVHPGALSRLGAHLGQQVWIFCGPGPVTNDGDPANLLAFEATLQPALRVQDSRFVREKLVLRHGEGRVDHLPVPLSLAECVTGMLDRAVEGTAFLIIRTGRFGRIPPLNERDRGPV